MSGKPVRPHTRLGKYELGKTIGEGSFAKVKFAKNVENGNHVAIKILDRSHVLSHKMTEQLKKEISAMKIINHPNVVKIYEVMASKTKIYIVLELINGGELFDKIAQSGRLKEDEARSYFHQLINAVDYCHSRGVYHRDLKPENLLLDSNGVLKISDFGLSTYAQKEDELLRTACGTPNYVAPEVLNDRGYVGSTSDIWSCGVILFVLMAGYLPFDEPSQMALYKKICRAQFTCPSWFSSEAKKLLKRILDPNPLTRIKIPEILEDEWFRKGYKPAIFTEEEDVNVDDVAAAFNDSKNGIVKRETSFTSQRPANEIMSKIEEAAKPLGFNVHKRNYKMKLQGDKSGRKGHLSVATEVFEVAPSLHMVELRKTGGDTLEFHKFYKIFSSGLQDVVWHSEAKI
ncbi:CBL-interacting serine/threonine-protein kinase 9 isoform X3 [Vigna angularis]|uniref:CBL-interacting serine/threonine-protein kinase 9 isoform X3 n=1 Tax=Phaseolus angularis TaxID=3914 RepID=UPI0022B48F1E|nr:CBL-interacting serine/threonine-protein kinase 9 isoform X3 [Vigna angularis]